MSKEEVLIKHIQDYLDSGMYRYEACYLDKEDLKLIIKALKQIDILNFIRIEFMAKDGLEDALEIIDRYMSEWEAKHEH